MSRTTGSWVVKRGKFYLIGGPFAPDTIRSWLSWGGAADAYVFPTKTAAREAVRGVHGCTIERSYGHEEAARA